MNGEQRILILMTTLLICLRSRLVVVRRELSSQAWFCIMLLNLITWRLRMIAPELQDATMKWILGLIFPKVWPIIGRLLSFQSNPGMIVLRGVFNVYRYSLANWPLYITGSTVPIIIYLIILLLCQTRLLRYLVVSTFPTRLLIRFTNHSSPCTVQQSRWPSLRLVVSSMLFFF